MLPTVQVGPLALQVPGLVLLIGLWIGLQAFVSMGVNLGVLPTKGLTLPLISSGGSSVLMTFLALGIVFRIRYELDRDAPLKVARVPNTGGTRQ